MKGNYFKATLALILLVLCFILGFKQFSPDTYGQGREYRAEAERLLVKGNYQASLDCFQRSLENKPLQAGVETISTRLEQIVSQKKMQDRQEMIIELGQELIRQRKFHLAMLMYKGLIRRSPGYLFKAEKDIAILQWWRGDRPGPDGTFQQYSTDNLSQLYKLLFIYVYPPMILSQHYHYDSRDDTFLMEIVLDRVYPEHIFRMDWVSDQQVIHTHQWNFNQYRENTVLRTRVWNCPDEFLFYLFHKHKLMWLEQKFVVQDGAARIIWSNVDNCDEEPTKVARKNKLIF